MKKICHVTSAHNSLDERIFYKECISLAREGYETYLVAAGESFERGGVSIVGVKKTSNHRLYRMFTFTKRVYQEALKIDADIYHLHDPELLSVGKNLKKIGKKVIFDSHEDVPAQIMDKSWIPKPLRGTIAKTYALYEKFMLKRLDAVISVTPHLTERLKAINKNTVQITNYPVLEEIKTNNLNKKTICFAGGISAQWKHKEIIEALQMLKNVRYTLAGSGEDSYLSLLKSMEGWQYVDYYGKIPHEEVKYLCANSSIGMTLLNYSKNAGGKIGTLGNTKIFEYMMAGIPVICTDFKLWYEIVENYKCGICINPDDISKIFHSIEYLTENPEIAHEMGRNGKRAVIERYNWGTQEKILLEIYKKLEQ